MPLIRHKSNQRKQNNRSVNQTTPIHCHDGRIRRSREEHQHESQPQETQGENIDRKSEFSEWESCLGELVAGDFAVGDTGDGDDVAAEDCGGAEASNNVEGSVRADEDEGEEDGEG